jgi:hypothetical protein
VIDDLADRVDTKLVELRWLTENRSAERRHQADGLSHTMMTTAWGAHTLLSWGRRWERHKPVKVEPWAADDEPPRWTCEGCCSYYNESPCDELEDLLREIGVEL